MWVLTSNSSPGEQITSPLCLNISCESNPCGPVSFDLIKLQRPVPRPIITQGVWNTLMISSRLNTRLCHPPNQAVRKTQRKTQYSTKQTVAVTWDRPCLGPELGQEDGFIPTSFLLCLVLSLLSAPTFSSSGGQGTRKGQGAKRVHLESFKCH